MSLRLESGIACILLAVLVGGCAGPEGPAPELLTSGPSFLVSGFVLTPAIQPIAGATVTLDDDASTVTDASGAFAFSDVPPGGHRIRAAALGYQTSIVEVVAGEAAESLRIVMSPLASEAPRVVPYQFQGQIECGIQVINPAKGGCFPLVFGDVYWARWDLEAVPAWVQTDMIWRSTQTLGQDLWIQYDCIAGDACPADSLEITSTSGPSPLSLFMEPGLIAKWQIGDPQELSVRVFPASAEEPVMLVLQQDFTHYTHVFYNISPPAGWNFLDHGAPPA